MEYALDRFTAEVKAAIAGTGKVPAVLIETVTPKPNIPADLAFPAFRAAKELALPPPQLAQQLAAAISPSVDSLIGGVNAAGPFLNFSLQPQRLAAEVLAEIAQHGDRYGHDDLGGGKTVVVDYSAPNVAKRMHVGHIRSTIIGQAIVNIFRAMGYRVIGDNHLGDWGTQFGMVIAAIMREGKPEGEGEGVLAELEAMYSRYANAAKEDQSLADEARRWSLRLEQGDPQARELWQWCVDMTLRANQHNYDRLGVEFDHAYGESFYEPMLMDVIREALDKGVALVDDGAVVVGHVAEEDGERVIKGLDDLPKFLIQRNDGGTLYITRDMATVIFRMREFNPAQILYVVGEPQSLHLRQLFAVIRAMGYAQNVDLIHISFGTIFDTQGQPLSTRRGNMVYLETLLNDAVARARVVVEDKSPELPEAEKTAVAEAVGVGAVVYNDLYQDPKRNITLDWEKMLAREGNSATYLQYSHARCCSILRTAEADGVTWESASIPAYVATSLHHPAETQLLKHLARLPEVVRESASRYAPFVIADWCYTTAREFSSFYNQCPVLKAETPELRTARLHLVRA
ncbi:MAG: arginine--tRNA ligase, partial [Chloroflexaceae bacterium]|nr:arginine--tRNA ligase [Chloroflexaceae bacterium]